MPMLREHASTQHSRGFPLPEGQCFKMTCVSTCPIWIHTPLSSVLQCDCQVQGPMYDRTRVQKVMRPPMSQNSTVISTSDKADNITSI